MFDFRDRNYREELRKQEVACKEQAECSHIKSDLPDRWRIISRPAARKVITIDGSNDDHKTFEPHTDIHDHRHKERYRNIPSHLSEPEYLRRQHVTTHHQPVAPSVRTEWIRTVFHERPHFKCVLS